MSHDTLTPLQRLAHARATYEALRTLRMKSGDTFVGTCPVGDRVAAVIMTSRTKEGARETRVTHKGVRTVMLDASGAIVSDVTVWHKLDTPEVHAMYAVRNTPERVAQDVKRYQECYRPGYDHRLGQRDSYARACQGYTN
jgi:hypothetical protein